MAQDMDGLSACIARAQAANAGQEDLQAAAQAFEQVQRPNRSADWQLYLQAVCPRAQCLRASEKA